MDESAVGPMDDGALGPMTDEEVEALLEQLDGLLGRVDTMPGSEGDLARSAVAALAEVYGEALGRLLRLAALAPGVADQVVGDELLSHLLALHGLHPVPPDARVQATISEIQHHLHGGTIQLQGIEAGTAKVQVSPAGCGSEGLAASVRDVLLGAVPELVGVEASERHPSTFIPLGSLHRRDGP